MSKFNRPATSVRSGRTSPLGTTGEQTVTHEGGAAFVPTERTELVMLAATHFYSEASFYDTAAGRDDRLTTLAGSLAHSDPEWLAGFIGYLRNDLRIRSGAIALAAEYVRSGAPGGRAVVNSVLSRGDEPGEMIAYWHQRFGRSLPAAVKRGVADAAVRLYGERNVLRWDSPRASVRFADVIELVHPKPKAEWQSALFKYLLDERHNHDGKLDAELLPMLTKHETWQNVPEDQRRAWAREYAPGGAMADAGVSWEQLSSWLPGGMDAEAWEMVIPQMGVMALIRNLRNFDKAGISREARKAVNETITDPEAVERSRLFPYQVWAAYKNAPSDFYKVALANTLALAMRNVPSLPRTLVLVDVSGSMQQRVSFRSEMMRCDVAAVAGASVVHNSPKSDLVIYADYNKNLTIPAGQSPLRTVQRIVDARSGGTYTHTAIRDHYQQSRHDRVLVITDGQAHDNGRGLSDHVPLIYAVDVTGERPQIFPHGKQGRYAIGGFSDSLFSMIQMLEAGEDARWPWEQTG